MESNTISQTAGTRFKLQIKEAAIILGITILMPFIIHLLPVVDSVPLGARLLPIFYAPLIAVIFFRWHVGLLAALLAPAINFLITGSPQWQVVIVLTYELTLFVSFVYFLKDLKGVRWFMGPLAYLMAKVCSVVIVTLLPSLLSRGTAIDFGINSVTNGVVGLAILLALNIFALKIKAQRQK